MEIEKIEVENQPVQVASELSARLGARFGPLLNYLEHKKEGGWGWGSDYDDAVCSAWGSGGLDYAYLKGHYTMLLHLALELIPPAYIEGLRDQRA